LILVHLLVFAREMTIRVDVIQFLSLHDGATTLSIMTLSIMTLSITTLSIMTLSIMTLSITTFSITINEKRH
jgi:hypothetical protein